MSSYDGFDSLYNRVMKLSESAEPPIKTKDLIQGPSGRTGGTRPVTVDDMRGDKAQTTEPNARLPLLPYPLDSSAESIADILVKLEDLQAKMVLTFTNNPSINKEQKEKLAEGIRAIGTISNQIHQIVKCISALDGVKSHNEEDR